MGQHAVTFTQVLDRDLAMVGADAGAGGEAGRVVGDERIAADVGDVEIAGQRRVVGGEVDRCHDHGDVESPASRPC